MNPASRMLLRLAIGLLVSNSCRADSMFSIGNSLTLDCCGANAIAAFDASLGNSLTQSYHIWLGSALDHMVARPEDTTEATSWSTSLPLQTWNFLGVEPYPSGSSTLQTDLDAIATFIAAASTADPSHPPEVLLYAAWPSQISFDAAGSFAQYWNQPVSTSPDQPTILARHYYEILLARLVERYGETVRFRIVPVGDAMAAVDEAIRAGEFPELSAIDDFYRDVNHLGDAGRYFSGLVTIMALRRIHAHDLPVPATYQLGFRPDVPITAPLASHLEEIANGIVPTSIVTPPTALSATTASGTLQLSWTTPAETKTSVLYQSAADGAAVDPYPAQFHFGDTQATVDSLLPGRAYLFAVRAISNTDISALSQPLAVTIPPAVPAGLQAAASVGSIALSWQAAEGAGSYDIDVGDTADAEAASPSVTGVSGTSYVVQVSGSSAARYYFVRARAGTTSSAASQPVLAQALAPPIADRPPTPSSSGGGGGIGGSELTALLLALLARLRGNRRATASD